MFQQTRFPVWIVLASMCLFLASALPVFSQSDGPMVGPFLHHSVHNDVSPALRDLPTVNQGALTMRIPHEAEPLRRIPLPSRLKPANEPDMALQQTAPLAPVAQAPALGLGFDGLGNASLGFTPNAAPPDTNGAVGATQYVQWVNESFAVFNKSTGALVAGPTAGNSLWAGFGAGCQTNNDGDPIVAYDKAA